jgi:hypothetical protein
MITKCLVIRLESKTVKLLCGGEVDDKYTAVATTGISFAQKWPSKMRNTAL